MAGAEPIALIEATRHLLERGREPAAVLQGLTSLLRDLVLAGTAPDRLELTAVSPQFRPQLPDLARSLGRPRLLQWQAQLKGSEQQLRHSVNPRLWLEVLLLGLLAEPVQAAAPRQTAPPSHQPAPQAAAVAPAEPEAVATPVQATSVQAAPKPVSPNAPQPRAEAPPQPAESPDLHELWQQILACLELPSTRMLLSQQARLVRLDGRRAVVQVSANWIAMVQSRQALVEQAIAKALGSPRQMVLEAGGEPPQAVPAAAGAALPANLPATTAATRPAPAAAPAAPMSPPPAAAPAPAPVPATAVAASPTAATAAAGSPTLPNTAAGEAASQLDDRARRLAEFFNGEVVDLEGPLEELDIGVA
jgi:DNA polymerase-3 subunit gamma/tau